MPHAALRLYPICMNRPASPRMIALAAARPSLWPAERFAIGAAMLAVVLGMQFVAWLAV
jgi:hypothetical protein